MSSCLGFGRKKRRDSDTEALLPQYHDDETQLQRTVHPKLHTYQMLRALSIGYMPSTEQVIINLRTILASDLLNAANPELSDSSILLVKYLRRWLQEFIELLRVKNNEDQLQEFVWCMSKAKVRVDAGRISKSASKAKERADARAAYQSLSTVGHLLMTNSDFRIFLGDLGTIGRQVFSDTAYTFSTLAKQAGQEVEPSAQEHAVIENAEDEEPPPPEALEAGAKRISSLTGNGVAKAGQETISSVKTNISGAQGETLRKRLKSAVLKLQQRPDYNESASTISLLLERFALAYSRSADEVTQVAIDSFDSNLELDQAFKSFWQLLSSFGDRSEWTKLKIDVQKLLSDSKSDPEFEKLVKRLSDLVQQLLQDPDFYDAPVDRLKSALDGIEEQEHNSSFREDLATVSKQAKSTLDSLLKDTALSELSETTLKVLQIFSPTSEFINKDLLQDLLHVSIPLLIQSIQYIPIPRLEISVPEVDLLLENLVIEPGKTINHTSFLPYKLLIQNQNDLEIRKTHVERTTASSTNMITISVKGLSLRAEEAGYWLRAHKSLLNFGDQGIASFELDERGIDITLDIEVGKEKLESILSLRKVHVHVHKLDYQLRGSKFSWLAWLVKPIMRPIIRKVMEVQLANAIADGLHAANRELVFARERLRATRISDPQDLRTFFKAVLTRLTPAEDPDVYTYLGVRPSQGVFRNVYAPGSLVKLWEDEARFAKVKVEDNEIERGSWRNEIFDVIATGA